MNTDLEQQARAALRRAAEHVPPPSLDLATIRRGGRRRRTGHAIAVTAAGMLIVGATAGGLALTHALDQTAGGAPTALGRVARTSPAPASAGRTRSLPPITRPAERALTNVRDFYAQYHKAVRHGHRAVAAVIRAHAASWYAPIIASAQPAGFEPPGCGTPGSIGALRYQLSGMLAGQDVIVGRWHSGAGQPLFAIVMAADRSGKLTGISCVIGGNPVNGGAVRTAVAGLFGQYLAARRAGLSPQAALTRLISGNSSAWSSQYLQQAMTATSARALDYDPLLCTRHIMPGMSFGKARIVAGGAAALIVVQPRHTQPIVVVAMLGAKGWTIADVACQRP